MEKRRSWILSACVLAAGMAASGYFVGEGIVRFKKFDQRVEVRGLAERMVESDEASWDIHFTAAADDMSELNRKIQATQKAIHEFLKKNGIQDREISRQPVQVRDKLANDYGTGKGARFTAQAAFLVASRDVAKLTETSQKTDELIRAGVVFSNSPVQYYFTALNSIKPAMLEEATKNAREAAVKFAETAGARIGEIKSATQGLFSIGSQYADHDYDRSFKKKVRVVTQVEFFLE